MNLKQLLMDSRAAVYTHDCGQMYMRTAPSTAPRHFMIICERCLEPMPTCDEGRLSYCYKAVALRRLNRAPAQKTERPVLQPKPVDADPLSLENFQWSAAESRLPRRIAFASSTWI